jgi:hypothetical protein
MQPNYDLVAYNKLTKPNFTTFVVFIDQFGPKTDKIYAMMKIIPSMFHAEYKRSQV